MRTNKGDLAIREGRLRKAQQFAAAAEDIMDLAEEADDADGARADRRAFADRCRPGNRAGRAVNGG